MLSSSFKRSKHILNRFYYIRDLVTDDMMTVVHCPTSQQIADLLGKVKKDPRAFELLRDNLLFIAVVDDSG